MAKTLQDRIKDLEDYRPDITYKDGAFILKIKFNERWQLIKPKDKDVAFAPDERVKDLYWYCSTIENSDKLFDLIDETIAVNKEFEKKTALYKEKVKELQELFLSDISYERLKQVQFVIQDKETKPKAKKTANKVQKEEKKVEVKVEQGNTSVETDSSQYTQLGEIDMSQDNVSVSTGDSSSSDTSYSGDIDDAIEKALGEK